MKNTNVDLLQKQFEDTYEIIINMLDIDADYAINNNTDTKDGIDHTFDTVKAYLNKFTICELQLLKDYISETKCPWSGVTVGAEGYNPADSARKNNLLITLIEGCIENKEEFARMNGYYKIICELDLTKVEDFLDTIETNDLLLLNYDLTWFKLDHGRNNIEKDKLLCSLISSVLNNRLGPGLSRE